MLPKRPRQRNRQPLRRRRPLTRLLRRKISEESAKLRGTTVKAPRIRQTIARRMKESLDTSAQLTQVQEVDMTRIATMRQKAKAGFKEQNGANLTFLPFIAKAVVEALKAHPKLNASYDSEIAGNHLPRRRAPGDRR